MVGTPDRAADLPPRHRAARRPRVTGDGPRRPLAPVTRRVLVAVTLAWVAVTATWSVLLPTYRSADESHHISAILSMQYDGEWGGYRTLNQLEELRATRVVSGWTQREDLREGYYPLAAEGALPRSERPSLVPDGTITETEVVNSLGQHPPGYYVLGAAVNDLTPATLAFDMEAWALRLLSVALLAPLPWLLAAIATRLGADPPAAIAASLVPLGIPQLGALGGAVNNDNLLILSCTAVALLAARIATGDLRARTTVLVGLALACALLSKAWALMFVPVVVLAYVIGGTRTRRWGRAAGSLVAAGALSCAGGWWWVRNYLVFGTLQPAGHSPSLPEPLTWQEGLPTYLEHATTRIPMRFWATLSIKDGSPPYPYALTTGLAALVLAGLVIFLVRKQSFAAGRADALLLVLPFLLCLASLLYSTWGLYLDTGTPRGLQGRYLFAAIAAPAAALGVGVMSMLTFRARWWAVVTLGVGAVAFTVSAMLQALAFHWTGGGNDLLSAARALVAWAAPVPTVTLSIVALLALALTTVLVLLLHGAAHELRSAAPHEVRDRSRGDRAAVDDEDGEPSRRSGDEEAQDATRESDYSLDRA
ncbi:glycosyltransferase family 39 protein [Actinotalea sp. BY-33]|uniref:Glycosyltransferase family 39 protein n=1 Tax=Actinotalea soli TaxID=2819234 RepID=A0A939LNZ3_9CELL|nr:glycosyltransferase family 39 protein [Actinotalea soli]MBO1750948.1 glycosyltransferase family 39 protein [Actinotalea soli]